MLHKGMDDVSKIPHTMRRKQTYYLRQRIPTDLIPAYGGKKDIVKSLGTKNPAEARRRVHIELLHLDSEFAQKRKAQTKPTLNRSLTSLSDAEIASMVLRWHQEQTTATETQILRELTPDLGRREEIIETLQDELGEAHIRQMHGIEYLQSAIHLLNDQQIGFDENSDQFKKLQLLLSKASTDLLVRSLQYYQGKTVLGAGDPFFSQAQQRAAEKSISFKQLCDNLHFKKSISNLNNCHYITPKVIDMGINYFLEKFYKYLGMSYLGAHYRYTTSLKLLDLRHSM